MIIVIELMIQIRTNAFSVGDFVSVSYLVTLQYELLSIIKWLVA